MIPINNYLIILPLIYIITFFLFTFLKLIFPNFMHKNNPFFCTVCGAYFSTLIIGFILKFDPIILSFMLGMSMTGIAKKSDEYLFFIKKKNYFAQFFILQLIVTIIGLAVVIFYLNNMGGI